MNGKPDWFLRVVLVAILLVLAAHLYFQFVKVTSTSATPSDLPVGRYVQFPMDDRKFVLLDTRTGNVYAYDIEKKTVVEINLVDLANKQKDRK
jgi:hypothetical protein